MSAALDNPYSGQLPTCDFHLDDIDPACPRFVNIRFRTYYFPFKQPSAFPFMHAIVSFIYTFYDTGWFERAGLGDRFFQLMVGLTYALHLNGTRKSV